MGEFESISYGNKSDCANIIWSLWTCWEAFAWWHNLFRFCYIIFKIGFSGSSNFGCINFGYGHRGIVTLLLCFCEPLFISSLGCIHGAFNCHFFVLEVQVYISDNNLTCLLAATIAISCFVFTTSYFVIPLWACIFCQEMHIPWELHYICSMKVMCDVIEAFLESIFQYRL